MFFKILFQFIRVLKLAKSQYILNVYQTPQSATKLQNNYMRRYICVVSERKTISSKEKTSFKSRDKRSIAPENCLFRMSRQFRSDHQNNIWLQNLPLNIHYQNLFDELQVVEHHPFNFLFEMENQQIHEEIQFQRQNKNLLYQQKNARSLKNGKQLNNFQNQKEKNSLSVTKQQKENLNKKEQNYLYNQQNLDNMKISAKSLSTSSSLTQTTEKIISIKYKHNPCLYDNPIQQKIKLSKNLQCENTKKFAQIRQNKKPQISYYIGLKLNTHQN